MVYSDIIIDHGGHLQAQFEERMRKNGFHIATVDFTDPDHSSHLNPFWFLISPRDVGEMVTTILAHTEPSEECGKDPELLRAERDLLTSAVTCVLKLSMLDMDLNMESVIRLLSLGDHEDPGTETDDPTALTQLDRFFEEKAGVYGDAFLPYQEYLSFRNTAWTGYYTVLRSCLGRLSEFRQEAPMKIMMEENASEWNGWENYQKAFIFCNFPEDRNEFKCCQALFRGMLTWTLFDDEE